MLFVKGLFEEFLSCVEAFLKGCLSFLSTGRGRAAQQSGPRMGERLHSCSLGDEQISQLSSCLLFSTFLQGSYPFC